MENTATKRILSEEEKTSFKLEAYTIGMEAFESQSSQYGRDNEKFLEFISQNGLFHELIGEEDSNMLYRALHNGYNRAEDLSIDTSGIDIVGEDEEIVNIVKKHKDALIDEVSTRGINSTRVKDIGCFEVETLSYYSDFIIGVKSGEGMSTSSNVVSAKKDTDDYSKVAELIGSEDTEKIKEVITKRKIEIAQKPTVHFTKLKSLSVVHSDLSNETDINFNSLEELNDWFSEKFSSFLETPEFGGKIKVNMKMENEDGSEDISLSIDGMGRIEVGTREGYYDPRKQHVRDYIAGRYDSSAVKLSVCGAKYTVSIPEAESSIKTITPNMVRRIEKTGNDKYLISYSSAFSETPECDTISLEEARAIFEKVPEQDFRENIIPYLTHKEGEEMVADLYMPELNYEIIETGNLYGFNNKDVPEEDKNYGKPMYQLLFGENSEKHWVSYESPDLKVLFDDAYSKVCGIPQINTIKKEVVEKVAPQNKTLSSQKPKP